MRIIRLGSIDVQFCCSHCKTIWENNTTELKKDENNCYYVECPLCDERIVIKDNWELTRFLKKREEYNLLKEVLKND